MQATNFDGMTRQFGTGSTRRGVVRLLAGAAALGAGLVLGGGTDSLARRKGKARASGRERVAAQGKKGRKKVTICYQGQTRTVKKSKLGNFPGATRGACPAGGNNGGNQGGNNGGNNGGGQQPVACTSFILSGGPNQSDPIVIDDDGSILNVTTGKFLFVDNNGMAGPVNPIVFAGKVGDVLRVRATDWGGCRSFSPLWVHCLATGQKKQLFTGYNGSGCANPKGDFLDMTITVEL